MFVLVQTATKTRCWTVELTLNMQAPVFLFSVGVIKTFFSHFTVLYIFFSSFNILKVGESTKLSAVTVLAYIFH